MNVVDAAYGVIRSHSTEIVGPLTAKSLTTGRRGPATAAVAVWTIAPSIEKTTCDAVQSMR